MKRYLLSLSLLLCTAMTALAQFSGSGNGTEADPYLIFNETQLAQMANFLNNDSVVFKLQKDLDLTSWIAENNPSQGWLPVGVLNSPFKGKFYGNNHKIGGLSISRTGTDKVGLFGYLSGAVVSDLTIVADGTVKGGNQTALLAGWAVDCMMTNVSVEGNVNGSNDVGLLCGCVSGCTFSGVTVKGTLEGQKQAGALAGTFESSQITTFNADATVQAYEDVGGVTGRQIGGCTLKAVNFIGKVSGLKNTGGITGNLASGAASYTSCFSKGEITASGDYCGGIVGYSAGGNIAGMQDCSHFGDIYGQSYVGGIIGAVANVTEKPTLHKSELRSGTGDSYTVYSEAADQIVTGSPTTVAINNCVAIGNISGQTFVGGLIGSEQSTYGYSSEKTNKSSRSGYKFVDGVYDNKGWQTLSYYVYSRNYTSLSLTNNYYSGVLKGTENIGGLVGYKSGGELKYNYSYATIEGETNVGGIAGQISDEAADQAYNTTTVKSNVAINTTVSATKENIGRICDVVDDHVEFGDLGSQDANRALATTHVIKQGVVQEVSDDQPNGNSIGASMLKLKASYVAWGWNFDDNWNIQETECYPYKKYQAAPPVIQSDLVSKATSISGKSLNGGTVYLYYKNRSAVSTQCSGNNWTFSTDELQSGAQVQIYADVDGMTPSYFTSTNVQYPGSGTEDDPFRIYTAEDLQGASNRGYYKLMNDVDLASWISENNLVEGWVAIGRNSGEATYIDGDGHRVTGLWIDSDDDYTGLFSNFSAGQLKNLTVEVADGKTVKGGNYVGILIGRNANGRIVNCSVKGSVEGNSCVGGVAGYVSGTQLQSVNYEGTVTATGGLAPTAGGIAGYAVCSDFISCNAVPAITSSGSNDCIGGLVGQATHGSYIEKCVTDNQIAVTGYNSRTGGLVGSLEDGGTVTTSLSKGAVSSTGDGDESYTGGLVGYAAGAISDSYSTAATTGGTYVAGLVGYSFSTINRCYAKGNVKGTVYGAGVVAELDGADAKLTNSVAACDTLRLTAQSSWASRVIGGYKNGAADPDNSNYALSTMQVSLNGVPTKKTDDIVEGVSKTEQELMSAATYTALGWNLTDTWGIDEGTIYPYLLWEVDVNPVADITFDKTTLLMAVGKTAKIEASVLPLGATNKRLQWKSSNTAVATVDDGTVTAVAVGSADITATSTDGSNVSATCKVTVTANKDASVAELQALVDQAQALYDGSTEGTEIGQYAAGSRAALLKVINEVKAKISDTMSDDDLADCNTKITAAMATFQAQQVTAGADTDISTIDNTLYIENFEARPGSQTTVSIKMKNTGDVQGFQFKLYLPDGMTVAKDADGDYDVQLSTARTTSKRTDLFQYALQTDGSMMVVCTSSKAYTFSGTDGEVAVIKVDVADSLKSGDYPIILKGIVMADLDGTRHACDYVKSTVTLASFTPGDVNNDGYVDVVDVSALLNHILGAAVPVFNEAAADFNGDGFVDVVDASQIAKFLLNGGAASAKGFGAMLSEPGVCSLYAAQQPGKGLVDVSICNGGTPFSAWQMDVTLPEGVSLCGVSLNGGRMDAATPHLLAYNRIGGNLYRVAFVSLDGTSFSGSDGVVVTLQLGCDGVSRPGMGGVEFGNILLSSECRPVHVADATGLVDLSTVTAIDGVKAEAGTNAAVYSLSGKQVGRGSARRALPGGVYIVNGKKTAVK